MSTVPPNFSHWAPGGDPNQAWSVAVDTAGQRWRQTGEDGPWEKVGDPPPSDVSIAGGSPMAAQNAPTDEVTNIPAALARLDGIARAHTTLGTGEGFLGSLRSFDVGEPDQQLYVDALELSATAGQSWAEAAASVRRNNDPVGQAYSASPGAGNKHANTNE